MTRVVFTNNLQRHVPCPPAAAGGATVREVDDQGDSWQCLAEHLPPIYAVRFA
jgi:hypothetical protein